MAEDSKDDNIIVHTYPICKVYVERMSYCTYNLWDDFMILKLFSIELSLNWFKLTT